MDVSRKLLAAGYPGAWQADLTAYARILGTDLIWIYQPLLAVTSAVGALALFGVLARAIESQPLRALAAGVAIQANVLYAYGLVGGFKELTAAFLVVLVAGAAAELPLAFANWRAGVPLAVALAARVATFSLGVLPWLGVIVGGFVVVGPVWSSLRPRVILAWASVGGLALVLSIPAIVEASKLAPVAAKAEGGSSGARTALIDLGNLAAVMPVRAATGIWPNEDYRYPTLVEGRFTGIFMVFVLALGAAGLVAALRRRDWGLLFLSAGGGLALAYYMARTGPRIQLKAIAITGVVVLACAFAGAAAIGGWLKDRGAPALVGSWLLAAVVAGGALYGNALAFHDTTPAPTKRFRDLERISNKYAGQGPAFYTDFDEDAEYILRKVDGVGIVDPPASRIPLRRPGSRTRKDELGFELDPDQLTLPYIQSFSLIIRRRGPERSRPPGNWELSERTRYHEVWRRARPAAMVLLHEPYEGPRLSCSRFAAKARAAARSEPAKLAYVGSPDATRFRLGVLKHPPNWSPKTPSTLVLGGRGRVSGTVRLPRSGTYAIWIAGDFGRVNADHRGRQAGGRDQADAQLRGPVPRAGPPPPGRRSAPHRGEQARRRPGARQRVRRRGSGRPIVFVRPRPLPVRTAPVADAFRICSRGRLDWVEVVRDRYRAEAGLL